MASTYSDRLHVELVTPGEQPDSWGATLNTTFGLLDDAIAGMVTVNTTGGTYALTSNNGATDQSRFAMVKITGTLVSNATIQVPAETKQYVIWNATSGAYTLTISSAGGGSTVGIAQGAAYSVFCDGASVYRVGSGGSLADATGLPISTGVTGLAAGVATFLATPNSTTFNAMMQDTLVVAQATTALGLKSATTTVSVSAGAAPIAGQVLTALSGTQAEFQTFPAGAGLGDVSGPASATLTNIATFANPSGKLIGDSGVPIANLLLNSAIGVTVQAYSANLAGWSAIATTSKQAASANLDSWSAIAPSVKQDTLVSATNIKTVNSTTLLGSGDLAVGYRNVPNGSFTSGTLTTALVGKHCQLTGATTIPNSTFAADDVVVLYNNSAGDLTITCSITTAYIAGTDTDVASVTLATRGVMTILFLSATSCVITGNVS